MTQLIRLNPPLPQALAQAQAIAQAQGAGTAQAFAQVRPSVQGDLA